MITKQKKPKRLLIREGRPKDADKKYSYWDDHVYTRRSINKDFLRWAGSDALLSTMNTLDQTTQRLFATTYETGGRAQEVLSLRPEQFSVDSSRGIVTISRMLVEKLRDVEDKTRTFPVLMESPFTMKMLEAVDDAKRENRSRLFPYGRHWMYKKFCDIEKPEGEKHGAWWIHRLRAEKATSLVIEHKFGVVQLMRFFNMQKTETPTFYTKFSVEDLINMIRSGKV